MIEIEDMRCFLEVVKSGGFNRAAAYLGISKSIVSRRIARIEADLDTVLLNRTTRGVSPTEPGLEFTMRCERILAEYDDAREAVAQHGGDVVGCLRLSAPLSFGTRHVVPVLSELAKRHPRLEIDVSFSDRKVDLIAERFDAAIRIGTLQDSSLIARRIGPARSVLVASPDYLDRRGRPEKPADLTSHDCLIYTGSSDPDITLRNGDRWVSVRPSGRLRSDNGDALLAWAIEGLGITGGPTFMLSNALESGAVEPVLADFPLAEHGIYVIRPPGANVPGKVRVLIDILVEHFGGAPHWDRCLMHPEQSGIASNQPAGTA
jgi:DNA-binding transcriptional LysR family regulator